MKKKIYGIYESLRYQFSSSTIQNGVYWMTSPLNVGDAVTPWLLEKLGLNFEYLSPRSSRSKQLLMAGSILSFARNNSIVYGSGLISENARFHGNGENIYALRGRKTEQALIKRGVVLPNLRVFGDPALMIQEFITPNQCRTNFSNKKIGVVAHYIDKERLPLVDISSVKIIDIQTDDVQKFCEELLECSVVFSSSLHGLIISDAMNVPCVWMKLSDSILGGEFKFMDYFSNYPQRLVPTVTQEKFAKICFDGLETFKHEEWFLSICEDIPNSRIVSRNLLENFPYGYFKTIV